MGIYSDYLVNKIVDAAFRGQPFSFPATVYVGLMTAAETAAGGGTEVSGGAYARVAVAAALANWAGTQGAGTTAASTGTSATTSNNGTITFPAPAANWGTIVGIGIFDAATAGNLLFYASLVVSKTVNNGDPAPDFAPGAISFQIDG